MSLWWLSPKRVSFVLPQVKEKVNPQENAAPAAVCVFLMCQRVSGILNQTLNVSVTQRCLRCWQCRLWVAFPRGKRWHGSIISVDVRGVQSLWLKQTLENVGRTLSFLWLITEVSGKSNIRSVNRCSIYWLQRALMCLWVWSYLKKIGIRSEDCGFWTRRAAVCHSGWFVASVIVWPSLTCRTTRDSCTVGRWAWFLTTRSYEPLDFTQNALEQLKHPGHQSLFQTDIRLLPPTDPVMLTLRADFTFRLCKCDFKLWNFSG